MLTLHNKLRRISNACFTKTKLYTPIVLLHILLRETFRITAIINIYKNDFHGKQYSLLFLRFSIFYNSLLERNTPSSYHP